MSSREQFEAWQKDQGNSVRSNQQGLYVIAVVQRDWEVWQASRQALDLTLPDDGISDCERDWGARCKDTFDCGYNYACEQHEKAIEAAGIRTKP